MLRALLVEDYKRKAVLTTIFVSIDWRMKREDHAHWLRALPVEDYKRKAVLTTICVSIDWRMKREGHAQSSSC